LFHYAIDKSPFRGLTAKCTKEIKDNPTPVSTLCCKNRGKEIKMLRVYRERRDDRKVRGEPHGEMHPRDPKTIPRARRPQPAMKDKKKGRRK